MLNTNQSHKKKSWKYAVILPFLIAFTLLFQIETLAQAKETKVEETTYAVSSSYSSILTKNTSDREIKELEKAFSDDKQKLKISNVKRNNNNEIIAIKLEFDYGKTYNRVMERKSDKGINSIKIYINSDKNDDLAYGFEDVDEVAVEAIEIDGLVKDTKSKTWSLDSMKKDGKEVVMIINGKFIVPNGKVQFSFDEEIVDIIEISSSEFEKKYNKKAYKDKLYYEVNTVKMPVVGVNYNDVIKLAASKEKTDLFTISTINQSADNFDTKKISKLKPMIILNGKKTEANFDISNIDVNQLETMNVLKGQKAIEKYGKEGENGVIEISTKENVDLLISPSQKDQNRKEDIQSRKFEIQARKDEIQARKDAIQAKKDLKQAKKDLKQAKKK